MEHLIDKILAAHDLMLSVACEVDTCGIYADSLPRWHIYGYRNFCEVAKSLGETPRRDASVGDDTYEAQYTFTHRGVIVFCLRTYEEVINDTVTAD